MLRYIAALGLCATFLSADTSSLKAIVPRGQLNSPRSVAVGANGAIYIAVDSQILKMVNGVTTAVAGTGERGFGGDGGPATAALLGATLGIAVDPAGNLYIADTSNLRVRKVAIASGVITTIAGNGLFQSPAGDGGPALAATIYPPFFVAVHPTTGNVYFNDGLSSIHRLDQSSGILAHVAGDDLSASVTPDGYPPLYVSQVGQMTFDLDGNLVFSEVMRVRKIDRNTNLLSTLLGPLFDMSPTYYPDLQDGAIATNTYFGQYTPYGIAFAPDGTLYYGTARRVMRVDPLTHRTMTVTAPDGTGVPPPLSTTESAPPSTVAAPSFFLAVNPQGELLFVEGPYGGGLLKVTFNRAPSITNLTASPSPSNPGQSVNLTASVTPFNTTGRVFFFDGATQIGDAPVTNGTAAISSATLPSGPHSFHAVYEGSLDTKASQSTVSHLVRAATAATLSVPSGAMAYGNPIQLMVTVTPAQVSGTVEFREGLTVLGTAQLYGGTATLAAGGLLAGPHTVSAVYLGDANYVPANAASVAFAVTKADVTLSISSSVNPSVVGSIVTFTTALSRAGASGAVALYDGSVALGNVSVTGQTASMTLSNLTLGSHVLTATYPGDANFNPANAPGLTQVVNKAPTVTTLASSGNPGVRNQTIIFTITVTSPNAPTGSVQIVDGTTTIASRTLAGGAVSYSTSSLSVGTHSLSARYLGDANNLPSTSAVLSQVINRK